MTNIVIDGSNPLAGVAAARAEALAQDAAREERRKRSKNRRKNPPAPETAISKGESGAHWRWKKGQSGNPSGRPRILINLRDLARSHTETAIKVLVEVALDTTATASGRVAAAEALLDRGYGKPVQHHEATVSVIDRLSDGDREAVLAILDAVAAARPVSGGVLEALPPPADQQSAAIPLETPENTEA